MNESNLPGLARQLAMVASLGAFGLSAAAAQTYVCRPLVDEATSPGTSHAAASDINNRNVAVGTGTGTFDGQMAEGPMQWGRNRVGHRLPDGADSGNVSWVSVAGINDRGRSVGMIFDTHGQPRPVAWEDGKLVELGSLAADGRGYASAINRRGTIVGKSILALGRGDTDRATMWRSDGRIVSLGALAKKDDSVAYDINADDVAVGMNRGYERGGFTPVRWTKGQIDVLADPAGGSGSSVAAINDSGISVGDTYYPGQGTRATAWRGLDPVDLGRFAGNVQTWAGGINSSGEIIGGSADAAHKNTPVYWANLDAAPVDLNTLVAEGGCTDAFGVSRRLTSVSSINDKGVMVAAAAVMLDNQWSSFAFRLTPR